MFGNYGKKSLVLAIGLAVLMQAGCTTSDVVYNEVTIYSKTDIWLTPPKIAPYVPARNERVFACTSIDALREYLDYGEITTGCGWRLMTNATPLGYHRTLDGRRSSMQYKFMSNGWWYYGTKP
jgi:hypothetical protein